MFKMEVKKKKLYCPVNQLMYDNVYALKPKCLFFLCLSVLKTCPHTVLSTPVAG